MCCSAACAPSVSTGIRTAVTSSASTTPPLGALRSAIAQGQFDGVGPFGEHFTGDVNPGAHQGTVGEEEFLKEIIGVEDLEAFCDLFE